MNRLVRPLTWSMLGHAAVLVALAWIAGRLPPAPPPPPSHPIAVVFEEPPPVAAAPTPPAAKPPPVKPEPPPPAAVAVAVPPPPPKPPVPHPVRRPVVRRIEPPPPPRPLPSPEPALPPPPQTASLPPPQPARPPPPPTPTPPRISTAYRGALSQWLQAHKTYPESARQRGEQGQAVLRFRVDRSGRVLDYAIVRSSGYPDLDAAVAAMMRGAVLPPFPADMSEPEIQVSLAIRFGLTR